MGISLKLIYPSTFIKYYVDYIYYIVKRRWIYPQIFFVFTLAFKTVFGYLSKIDDELQDIKSELAQIKSELSKKADLDYIKKLEQRVNKIEMDYVELRVIVKERK